MNWIKNVIVLKPEDLSNIISIIFGITSGILTVVGLLAIFISLSSQQKIQKARELFWSMQAKTSKDSIPSKYKENNEELKMEFNLYKEIMINDEDFTSKILNASKISLIVVNILWLLLCFIVLVVDKSLLINSIIFIFSGIAIISVFIRYLSHLKNIAKITMLPSPEKIIDVKEHIIDSLSLIANMMYLSVNYTMDLSKGKAISIAAVLPLGFINYNIDVTCLKLSSDEGSVEYTSPISINVTDSELYEFNRNTMITILSSVFIPPSYNKIEIELELKISQNKNQIELCFKFEHETDVHKRAMKIIKEFDNPNTSVSRFFSKYTNNDELIEVYPLYINKLSEDSKIQKVTNREISMDDFEKATKKSIDYMCDSSIKQIMELNRRLNSDAEEN